MKDSVGTHSWVAILFGCVGISTLLINWSFIGYAASLTDPGSSRILNMFGNHATLIFALVAALGVMSSCIAGMRHSRIWFALTILIAGSFMLEYAAS
jgi:hypothetical protein